MFNVDTYYSEVGKTINPLARARAKIKIRLGGGAYDPNALIFKDMKEIFCESPEKAWQKMLQYDDAKGNEQLRIELSRLMLENGIKADPQSEILVTPGSTQAFFLMSRLFIDPGDVIIVGQPTYSMAVFNYKQFGPEICPVTVDSDGMNTELLETELKRLKSEGKNVKFLYIIPFYQNPSNALLTEERCQKILELAIKYDFLILEDNPYGYISFEGPMPKTIKALDKYGRVVYTSTFSKIISPGIRVGWIAAREEFIKKMAEAKRGIDISTDGLSQYLMTELLKRGIVERQIIDITDLYRRKLNAMLDAIKVYFPEEAKWTKPKGGICLQVMMPEYVDIMGLWKEARQRGVAFFPGDDHTYLSYSHASEDDIREGIKILGELIKKYA